MGWGMFNKSFIASAVTTLLVINGCASYDEIKETQVRVESDISTEIRLIDKLKKEKPLYSNVSFTNRLFVAPTDKEEVKKPGWWFEPLKGGRANSVRLDNAISMVVNDNVNIKYGRNIDKSKKISFSGRTVGEAIESIASASGYSYQVNSENKLTWSMYETRSFQIATTNGTDYYGQGKGKGESSSDDKSITSDTEYVNAMGEIDALEQVYKELLTYSSFRKPISVTTTSYNDIPLPPVDSVFEDGDSKPKESSSDKKQNLDNLVDKDIPIYLNRATSTITVRDTPAVLDEMEKIVAERNFMFRSNVYLEIDIIEVKLTNEGSQAFDVAAIISDFGDAVLKTGVTTGTAASQIGRAATSLPTNIISGEVTDGRFKGTQLLMEALSYYGAVSSRTMPRQTMQPNTAAKLQDLENFYFISERSANNTANVGTESSIEQENKDVGFSLYVLPTIFENDVTLRMATNLSSLLELTRNGDTTTDANSGQDSVSSYVESPRTSKKDFMSKFTVRAGDTLVLSGLSREMKQLRRGKGISEYLANSEYGKSERVETIITVTPYIQRPRS